DDERCALHDPPIIDDAVISYDHYTVRLAYRHIGQLNTLQAFIVLAFKPDFGDMRIVVAHFSAHLPELFNDRKRRTLAHIIDVAFISNPKDKDARTIDSLSLSIESVCN